MSPVPRINIDGMADPMNPPSKAVRITWLDGARVIVLAHSDNTIGQVADAAADFFGLAKGDIFDLGELVTLDGAPGVDVLDRTQKAETLGDCVYELLATGTGV